ncbi:MAG: response regulator transcription factor [Acidobacteriaceae bacterium]|nr:response regulator transcription factor [Acidobacteriaceae bacterium]
MRVLVVEDDRALGQFLQKGLQMEGHVVEWCGDGESALQHAEASPADLMVLDLSLPRRDGTEVLAEVAERWPETSVLVLTGRSQLDERVRCLNSGADDCLLKPFSFHELTARCRAILRRRVQNADAVLRHGSVEMNRVDRTVKRDGKYVELTAKEFALLEFLLLRRGQSCSRGELLREVWQMAEDSSTNVVDVYVNYLRRKLAMVHPDRQSSVTVIETVRGVGYKLAEPLKKDSARAVSMEQGLARGA